MAYDAFQPGAAPPPAVVATPACFESSTTYGSSYVGAAGGPQPLHHARAQPVSSGAKFEGVSTHSSSYAPPPPGAYTPAPAAGTRPVPAPTGARLEATSTYAASFAAPPEGGGWRQAPARRGPEPLPPVKFEGSSTAKDSFRGWAVTRRAPVGVEVQGGRVHRLVEADWEPPLARSAVFTTTEQEQEAITVTLLQGRSAVARECTMLGSFRMAGIPPNERGVAQIELTLEVDREGVLTATARDLDSDRHAAWRSAGGTLELASP